MHIIDEAQEDIKRTQAFSNHALSRAELDPVVFSSEEGDVWTLGMVVPMWEWVFKQTADKVSQRTIVFLFAEILPNSHDTCAIG